MVYSKNEFYKKPKKARADKLPGQRQVYEKNRKKILMSCEVCAICGQPVDKVLKWPNPYCATVDHIKPVSKGGHPSDIDNLQLAHFICNRKKWDKEPGTKKEADKEKIKKSFELPLLIDWSKYNLYENGSNFKELYKEAEKKRNAGKEILLKDLF